MIFKYILDSGAKVPTKAHISDAGFDLYVPDGEDVVVEAGGSVRVDTGVHIHIPRGYVGMVKSKSGLNFNYGLRCEGVVDADYTGSIGIKMYNDSSTAYTFKAGDKIAQIVFLPTVEVELMRTVALDDTERAFGGFGSSGR